MSDLRWTPFRPLAYDVERQRVLRRRRRRALVACGCLAAAAIAWWLL